MKITIQKLGTIQNAELDLKPLTILVGPNNTGKTWLAYTIAGIFGGYGLDRYTQAYIDGQVASYDILEKAIERVRQRGDAKINLYEFADNHGEAYFNQNAQFAKLWMQDYMSTQYPLFDEMDISISLAETKMTFMQHIKDYSLRSDVAEGLLKIRKKAGDGLLYAYTSSASDNCDPITERLPAEEIRESLVSNFTRNLHRSLYTRVRVFPTERTAIVTFNFHTPSRKIALPSSQSIEKIQEMTEMLQKTLEQAQKLALEQNINIPNSSNSKAAIGPVGNFASMLGYLHQIGSREIANRNRSARTDPHIQKYIDLAKILEQEILGGNIKFSTVEPNTRRDILFQPAQNVNLEIPIASSMVKELSPLVLYLRYLALPGDLLIIDEPEMNLHPIAQVKMTEFLATLVNAGLNILITTHSTYVVDHLGNLMDAHKHEQKSEILEKFLLEREDAFIAQNLVSVYELTEQGEIQNILDSNGVIHWHTFSDVTELVQRIHFEL
jgi:hypothetical protein